MVEIIGKSYSLTTIKIYCRLLGFFPYDLVRKGDMICAKFSIKYGIWSYFLGINMSKYLPIKLYINFIPFQVVLGTTGVISSLLTLRTWVSPTFMNEMMIVYIVHLNLMFNIVYAFCCIVYTTFGRRNLNKFINNIMKVLTDVLQGSVSGFSKKNTNILVFIFSVMNFESRCFYL